MNRLRDYRRADLGISYTFVDQDKPKIRLGIGRDIRQLDVGFEIFNLFNNQNSITNTWVRDVQGKSQFAVPNFLTSRVFNIKLRVKL